MTAPAVFISYSHDSPEHANRVLKLADRPVGDGIDVILDQYEPAPPEGWPRWMDKKIRDANFVLMVCTETYYRRVMGEEKAGTGLGVKWEGNLIYQHIYNADTINPRFIPILFESCKSEHIPTPLGGATRYYLDSPDGYEELYRRITNQLRVTRPELGKLKSLPPRERKPDYLDIKVSLAKLPSTSPDLFGREKELALLDAAWQSSESDSHLPGDCHFPQKVNIFTFVAWGGVGKSALVNVWLNRMATDNYRGAERVFGWSFYSQGAAEGRQVSADQFIAAALAWFGDPEMANSSASAWQKGERLAELVKQSRTLLILDGLEPLQNPPPIETGKIKDPALTSLLRELARQNPGLVVISTRLALDDLKDFKDSTAKEIDLDTLADESGAAYLKYLGVEGADKEREQASHDFGGHALALTLLGRYLKVVHNGDIRKRGEIPHVMDEQKQGAHARRVMESYERWLQGKPELDILRLMGLFDRPAEKGALDDVREEAAIEGLTDTLQNLSEANWKLAVNNLRELRLLAPEDPHEPNTLDCHPLLREHFGEKLKANSPEAWRKGHLRLFIYYATAARPLPRTIEEMAPLYAAVIHGCQAGKYQDTFFEVYWKRILRTNEGFSIKKLGAIGSDLAILSGFFDPPWHHIVNELPENHKGTILNNTGYYLRALGRLAEAAQPMQVALQTEITLKEWKQSAIYASNLSELYLTLGDVPQVLTYAEQSVGLADKSGDEFLRMVFRVRYGDCLHQANRLSESQAAFNEAEEMQKKRQPEFSFLCSKQGFEYCDLLLSQGRAAEVERRASQTLEWYVKYGQAQGSTSGLLDTALDNLSLGRAKLDMALRGSAATVAITYGDDVSQSESGIASALPRNDILDYLTRAVDGLRQAGTQHHLPQGLLARAEYYCVLGDFSKAQKDLDEAFAIATRDGMGLFIADCHLESARLKVRKLEGLSVDESKVEGQKSETRPATFDLRPATLLDEARKHLSTAKEMIEKMGYHRRDQEVEELEKELDVGSA